MTLQFMVDFSDGFNFKTDKSLLCSYNPARKSEYHNLIFIYQLI